MSLPSASISLRGKTVLITGGRRVGSELALALADRGANVAMTYHTSRKAIEGTIADVKKRGTGGLALKADLSQPEEAEAAVCETHETFGRLDALVNMASVFCRTPFRELEPHDFDTMIAANLAAPYYTSVAAGRVMLDQKTDSDMPAKIVTVGDWATDRPYRDYLPYLVAKGGLVTMTLALAKELAPRVAVALVQPAMIDPPPDFTAEDTQAVISQTPLARVGTPGDLNRLILYLLEGTGFVTGACFRVDGGRFLGVD